MLMSSELLYTGITRARTRCTVLIQDDVRALLSMNRLESSKLARINSSLFEFSPLPEAWVDLYPWYEEGKVHTTLTKYMVQSKSEVIITNLLTSCGLSFRYDLPLFASDGTFYRPDFTIKHAGEDIYWEHLGRLDDPGYVNHWQTKEAWYKKHFDGKLVTTEDSPNLTADACKILKERFGCQIP
jgi:exodeoxyribonuclease V alpha subunit